MHAPLAKTYNTYFVHVDPTVDMYTWEYPDWWILDSQDADSIKFRFGEPMNDAPSQLTVTAHNACGSTPYTDYIRVRRGFEIWVYPNPVSSYLHLVAYSCLMERIAVYNTAMQLMLPIVVFNNAQNEFTMNVSDLNPNPYFLFVWIDQQQKPLVYKFVKKDP